MDERDFKLIEILAKTRNITKTAALLYTSQSSLSKRIAAIEQELGVPILLRSRQGIQLTPDGEEVLTHTTEAAKQLGLMRDAIDAGKGYVSGTLRAGVSMSYALYRLPDVLTVFFAQYPHVNTHIVTGYSKELHTHILNNTLDVAVIRGEFPWKGNKLLISREKVFAIRHPKDANKPYSEIPFIGRKQTSSAFDSELVQWLCENHIQIERHQISVDNINTCVEMVSRGIGWTIVPEICLENFEGISAPLSFADGEPFVRSTYLMYTESTASLPQVSAFIETVRDLTFKPN